MKIKFSLCLSSCILLGILFSNTACKKSNPPVGCIGVIPDTVNVMQGVDFVSCTKNANTYQWDFGDGNSAAADSVYHTYTTPGTYHGSLTTSNGQSSTKDFTIVVINNPAGYFTAGGITYFPGICDSTSQGVLSAITVLDSFVQQALTIGFAGGGLPTASGVYTVSDNDYVGQLSPGQVALSLGASGSPVFYASTGGNGTQKVYVTVMQNGKLNITGSNIEFRTFYEGPDSFPLTFNINQTR